MTRNHTRLFFAATLLAIGGVRGQSTPQAAGTFIRGVEGRLPLYASTNAPREAVAWLPEDTVLAVLGKLTDAPWVPVAAPETVSVWIYRDLVRDGVVLADKSQVRSGAGMACHPIASLSRGTPVNVRSILGDWLKIVPPADVSFWVLRDSVEPLAEWPQDGDETPSPPDFYASLIEALTNETTAAAFATPTAATPAAPPPITPAVLPPPELADYSLETSAVQGERVVLKGTLDWGGLDAVSAPFCLVAREGSGDAVPLCNLLVPEITYGPHIGANLTVEGTRWVVKGTRLPFVIPLSVRLSQ